MRFLPGISVPRLSLLTIGEANQIRSPLRN